MISSGDADGRGLIRLISVGLLCLSLVTCAVQDRSSPAPRPTTQLTVTEKPPAATTVTSTPAPIAALTATGTATSTIMQHSIQGSPWPRFEGCWGLETEEVSFEIRLQQEGLEVRGSFLLVKMCVVADELTACRIREGTLEGTLVAERTVDVQLTIPEYDDEGKVRLTLAPGGGALHWEEIDYPTQGLAGPGARYLPPSFDLVPCGS